MGNAPPAGAFPWPLRPLRRPIIATSCPYCLIMLDNAIAQRRGEGSADGVVVIDLAQVLADSVGLRKLS